MTLLPLFLFPEIRWWQIFLKGQIVQIELCESWVKQTGRSRYEIGGPNGRQLLVVPTSKGSRTRLSEVEIEAGNTWATQHWRALQTAYNSTPFFAHYKDELRELLFSEQRNLSELSRNGLEWVCEKLGIEQELTFTKSYEHLAPNDFRYTELNVKNDIRYPQVFEEKLGFMANLSVLDLLFHTGPEALIYLLSAVAPSE
ncbi:MAG: WbqC family protein [Flavobacteriales bacterium]|nr:WbqC family protein [Flavobacteriales bacterium]